MQISITRGLVELKRFDQRIQQALSTGTFGFISTGSTGKNVKSVTSNAKVATIADAETAINASIQSVRKLIENRAALKAAIVKSNASTQITFGGKLMTVAEAIELKNTAVQLNQYASVVSNQLTSARNSVAKNDSALDANIQSQISSLLGGDKGVQNAAAIQTITEAQQNLHKSVVVAEQKVAAEADRVAAEVASIKDELDFALSESNAKTVIEVEL